MSAIPHLLDIIPSDPFEFHFPTTSDDFWWDDHDTSDYLSDSLGSDCLGFSDSEFEDEPYEASDISFPETFYHISHTPDPIPEPAKNEEDVLIQKIASAISQAAPAAVYRRRKFSARRKRKRKKRKMMTASTIEPDLRSLWLNFVDVLPAKDPEHSPPPSSTLPTINLSMVNKQMLRRLPDVVYLPVLSCSPDPAFYERNIPFGVHDTLVSAFGKENPFGKLPAIHTDLGPIPPPSDSCYGYVWCDGGWRVQAVRPPVPDPGGGRGRDGGQRGEQGWRQREKKLHYSPTTSPS